MAEFKSENGTLFIDGKEVVKGWESYSGWYWFAIELDTIQDSVLADGKIIKDDKIYYGYVQGTYEEWGFFSEGELKSLGPRIWEIPKRNLGWSGRRQ